jgi:hypothetical protein
MLCCRDTSWNDQILANSSLPASRSATSAAIPGSFGYLPVAVQEPQPEQIALLHR